MVEGVFVGVNVMLSLMRVMSPSPAPNGYSLRVVGVPQSRGTVQIVSTYPASPEARAPRFLARGAPAPCVRH